MSPLGGDTPPTILERCYRSRIDRRSLELSTTKSALCIRYLLAYHTYYLTTSCVCYWRTEGEEAAGTHTKGEMRTPLLLLLLLT